MKTYKILSILTLLAVTGSAVAALDEGKKSEPPVQGQAIPQDQLDFFEKKIRPVLTDKCYKCHSEKAEKLRGGLLLDTREGIRHGGDSGPAVVPGNLKDSLLIEAINYGNKDTDMQPQKAGKNAASSAANQPMRRS